ncbi:MAG: type II toxin-antitoxin system Phd/YefM family antitoxin [Clostridia bacterium]|nr:type II toxin-antitoxin system Phd/YefM family antitoxin [Clostridia bacterium]
MEQKINIDQAASNFKEVLAMVEQNGSVVLQKDNQPMYVITKIQEGSDKKVLSVASQILEKHKHAFEVLGND